LLVLGFLIVGLSVAKFTLATIAYCGSVLYLVWIKEPKALLPLGTEDP
jgi:hypothetical protein